MFTNSHYEDKPLALHSSGMRSWGPKMPTGNVNLKVNPCSRLLIFSLKNDLHLKKYMGILCIEKSFIAAWTS
jgi:hypothetical protein